MKFVGVVGFQDGEYECMPGVWKTNFIERRYIGDVLKPIRRYQSTDTQNPNLSLSDQISIISDMYTQQHWQFIRYVVWNNVKWQVTDIDISQYPRVTLSLGGVYNENET